MLTFDVSKFVSHDCVELAFWDGIEQSITEEDVAKF